MTVLPPYTSVSPPTIVHITSQVMGMPGHAQSAYGYMHRQEYISIESMQLPETAFLHIDVTSSSANPISDSVVV